MKNKTLMTNSVLFILAGILSFSGCGKKEPAEEQPVASSAAAAPATPIDPATAATVSGTVKFEGVAPKPAKIDMSQDANCKGSNTAENLVVAGGDLASVFVYVKEGLGNRTFALPKDPVVLDQSGAEMLGIFGAFDFYFDRKPLERLGRLACNRSRIKECVDGDLNAEIMKSALARAR